MSGATRPSPIVIKLGVIVVALVVVTAWIAIRISDVKRQAELTSPPTAGDVDTGMADTSALDPACCPEASDGAATGASGDLAAVLGAGAGGPTMPADGKPLIGVPADLPVYNNAQLLFGFEQAADGWVQQMGVWTIPNADADDVMKYYEHAAEQRGFRPLADPSNPTQNRVLARDGQSLLLRVRQAGDAVRLSLIFRYTM